MLITVLGLLPQPFFLGNTCWHIWGQQALSSIYTQKFQKKYVYTKFLKSPKKWNQVYIFVYILMVGNF